MFLYAHWPLEALEGTAIVFWLRKALTNGKLKIENSALLSPKFERLSENCWCNKTDGCLKRRGKNATIDEIRT
jgi:hypothetical protein